MFRGSLHRVTVPTWGRVALWAAAGLCAVLVADAAVLIGRVPQVAPHLPGSGSGTTVLLVASDSRERLTGDDQARYADAAQSHGERADLVLLLRIPTHGPARLYSLPRDLFVGSQRKAPHRLGLALSEGPQSLVDSLCQDLGVGVDHLVIADFEALVGLVDSTGGVRVHVDAPMRDRRAGLALAAGQQRLDGPQALAWVRSRHPEVQHDGAWAADPRADLTRTRHAAEVLDQVSAALDNPVSVQRALWSAGPRLRRDEGLGPRQMLTVARALSQATQAGIVTVPATLTTTEVPFAFVTPQTLTALKPVTSAGCAGD